MADDAPKVKEDQSRQQATYGAAAMAMLKKTHVIVSGMNGKRLWPDGVWLSARGKNGVDV